MAAIADVDMEDTARTRSSARRASGTKRPRESEAAAAQTKTYRVEEDDGIAQRLVPRRSQQRVLFADVMAQEREIASLARDKRMGAKDKAAPPPSAVHSSKSSKKARAEARRTQRQALRRAMSPRSPDNRGRSAPLRVGKGILDLSDDDEAERHTAKKRRFANNEDAIQDSLLHSTAWRHVCLTAVPCNVLPDREDVAPPFAPAMDCSLGFFDAELDRKCSLPLVDDAVTAIDPRSGSIGKARELAQLGDRVAQLVQEITPLIKKCQSERARAAIANARVQVAAYLTDLPAYRERAMVLTEEAPSARLDVSRLEKVAAHKLLKNNEFPVNSADEAPLSFRVGRGDSTHARRLVPVDAVNYLSVIAPGRKSTTCIVTHGTHRIDDDPIMRYVPFFAAGARDQSKVDISQFAGFAGLRKETLVGCDDEANEYVLRYVNAQCDGNPAALEVVKRLGFSEQPLADIADMKRRVLREKLAQDRAQRLDSMPTVVNKLMGARPRNQPRGIRGRLEQPSRPFIVNYLRSEGAATLGLRSPNAFTTSEVIAGGDAVLSASYREFFCRRCFVYNCRNHGTHQPRPITRVDPRYPAVKAATILDRLAASDDPVIDEVPSSSIVSSSLGDIRQGVPIESTDTTTMKTDGQDNSADAGPPPSDTKMEPSEDAEGGSPDDTASVVADPLLSPQIRRSQRSQTAASTKASTMLLSQRPQERKKTTQPRARSDPDADASEYLGLDRVYRALTANERVSLLAADTPCGSSCFKFNRSSSNGADADSEAQNFASEWQLAEMILLDKLLVTLGDSPCAIARVLASKSCAEVAACTRRRETQKKSISSDEALAERLMENLRADRGRERSSGVAGNSYDHLRRTRQQRMRDRGANHEYVPCDHSGASCNSAGCSCMRRDHFCDKACSCARDCANRFPGCRCGPGECRTEACPCYFSLRECDPDVCNSCGACEVPVALASGLIGQDLLTTANRKSSVAEGKMCGNVNILRSKFARIAIAPSDTHGWGAFAREPIPKGSFIYEYTGSLLSQDEAERRGNVYDKSTVSFLFDLNEDSVVDATRKGNKSKFANHDSKAPKCFARIMLVSGDHRIGIYALEDIAAGDELFFNYGYNGVIPDWSQARIAGEKPASNNGSSSRSSSRSSSSSSSAPTLPEPAKQDSPEPVNQDTQDLPESATQDPPVAPDLEAPAPAEATEEIGDMAN